jgi:hypothetical protein
VTRSEKTLVSKGIVTSIEALAISAYELNLSSMAAKKISFVFKKNEQKKLIKSQNDVKFSTKK